MIWTNETLRNKLTGELNLNQNTTISIEKNYLKIPTTKRQPSSQRPNISGVLLGHSKNYRKTSNKSRTLVGNKIVDNSM